MPDSVIRTPHNDSIARPDRQTVGLVLSGGGAKGIAHVGVIKALEENNIPIDYVTGTSMGAIVGSLYSCGWSPDRMLEFFTSSDFGYWSTGTIPPERIYYYIQPAPTPKWLEVNINFKSGGKKMLNEVLPTSLLRRCLVPEPVRAIQRAMRRKLQQSVRALQMRNIGCLPQA